MFLSVTLFLFGCSLYHGTWILEERDRCKVKGERCRYLTATKYCGCWVAVPYSKLWISVINERTAGRRNA